MERKNVNLTKEQCQEIIEEIVTTSLHGFESGNAQVKAELKGTGDRKSTRLNSSH